MRGDTADAAAMKLLVRQHGYVLVTQLYQLGLTKDQVARRVRKGVLERVGYGVVALPGRTNDVRQRAMHAVLVAGHGAVASLWTAAALHGVDAPRDRQTHVTVRGSRRRRSSSPEIFIHRTRYLPAEHIVEIDGVPSTSLPRTIVDCASALDHWSALRLLDSASPSATMWRRIHTVCDRLSNGRPGVRAIADATAPDGADRIRSMLERMGRAALTTRGVPEGESNVAIHDRSGRIREVDLCYHRQRVIVEFDGMRFHGAGSAAQHDRATDRRLQIAGWRVLRFTWQDVANRPAEMAIDVLKALAER